MPEFDHPFIPPGAPSTPASGPFTPTHVAVATFLGSPLAGAVVMVLTAKRLGLPAARPAMLGFGVAIALLSFAAMLPDHFPSTVFTVASLAGMRALAQSEFADDLSAHTSRGGAVARWWEAVLIGLAVMIPLVVVIVLGVLLLEGGL